MNPTAIIIDDEPNLVEYLADKLGSVWPELDILGSAVNGRQALALFNEEQPDIVFLDIHMPGLNGLQVAEALPAHTHIVFVTAFDQYAVEAFERAAVDYLLKPVDVSRLERTVEKLKEAAHTTQTPDLTAVLEQLSKQSPQYLSWLRTGIDDVTELVPVDDVIYFQADQKYTTVVTRDREHLIRATIKDLETQLDPQAFWRVHRGIIVRVDQIVQAKRDIRGRYTLTLRDRPETLRTSQSYGRLFKHN